MARARRMERAGARRPARGELALAPTAWRVTLPAGGFGFDTALREALDRGTRGPRPLALTPGARAETVLVAAGQEQGSYRLRSLRVESVVPGVAAFLARAESGIDGTACAAFAAKHAIEPAELEAVVKDFVSDGVLLSG